MRPLQFMQLRVLPHPSTAWPPAPHREQRVTRERHWDLVWPMTWHFVQRRTEPAKADTWWGVQAIHTSVGRVQPSKVIRTALEGSPLRFFNRKTPATRCPSASTSAFICLSAHSPRGMGPITPSTVGTGMRH